MKFDSSRKEDALSVFHLAIGMSGGHKWTTWSIKAHMDAEAAKYPGNTAWRLDRWLANNTKRPLHWFIGWGAIVALCAFAVAAVVSLCSFLVKAIESALSPLGLGFDTAWTSGAYSWSNPTLCISFAIAIAGISLVLFARKIGPAEWITIDWHPSWGNPTSQALVPAEGRAIADAFIRLCPDVRFTVSRLEQANCPLDPVLWAVMAGEKRPLFVWDDHGTITPPNAYQT